MDFNVELRFQSLLKQMEAKHGEGIDSQAILFLIGVNELGLGYKEFSKREKTELMHIAICTILEPYGYYKFDKYDDDRWPHFTYEKPLPFLDKREQEHLIKEAIIAYFEQNDYYKTKD